MGEKPFRALAIDGGGMLGFYSAALLRALTREFGGGGDLGAKCNLLCGASAGALIACALAAGVAANDIVRLFQERGRRVFPRPMPRGGGARTLWWAWRHRRRAAADAGELRAAIDSALGEETFAQVYRRRGIAVCAPAIDIDSYQARIFRTPHSAAGAGDGDIKMIDACLAGAAAILFFPPHSIAGAGGGRRFADGARRFADGARRFADGGLWANNAVWIALADALQTAARDQDIHIAVAGLSPPPPAADAGQSGGEAVRMLIAAQASGHDETAQTVARAISSERRRIEIFRLAPAARPRRAFEAALGIDQADEKTLAAMETAANEDAQIIRAESNDAAERDSFLRGFFAA